MRGSTTQTSNPVLRPIPLSRELTHPIQINVRPLSNVLDFLGQLREDSKGISTDGSGVESPVLEEEISKRSREPSPKRPRLRYGRNSPEPKERLARSGGRKLRSSRSQADIMETWSENGRSGEGGRSVEGKALEIPEVTINGDSEMTVDTEMMDVEIVSAGENQRDSIGRNGTGIDDRTNHGTADHGKGIVNVGTEYGRNENEGGHFTVNSTTDKPESLPAQAVRAVTNGEDMTDIYAPQLKLDETEIQSGTQYPRREN